MPDVSVIASALGSPAGVFVEPGCRMVVRLRKMTLLVRTTTAFGLPLAAIFTDALQGHLNIPRPMADGIELTLHEALANAIIHGNLAIGSEGRGSIESYADFCAELDRRLLDPTMAARTIQIVARWKGTRLVLAVTDEGAGFMHEARSVLDRPFGRGLEIVRSMATRAGWNQRRRRLVMIFPISARAGT